MNNLNFSDFNSLSVFRNSNGAFDISVLKNFILNTKSEIDKIIKFNIAGIENLNEFNILNKDFILEFNASVDVDAMINKMKTEGVFEENLKYIEIFLEELESLCGWLDTETYQKFYERMERISVSMENCVKHLVD